MSEHEDLNTLLFSKSAAKTPTAARYFGSPRPASLDLTADPLADAEQQFAKSYVHWTTGDGKLFVPAAPTAAKITPGVYEIKVGDNIGLYFERIPVRTEGLLRFPDTNSDRVVAEIQRFWDREAHFDAYGLTYKRGILLYGPPGSGKSCTIQLIMEDVVARDGIVLKFNDPYLFIDGMRVFRQIQPDTPVVTIMEDIDAIIDRYNESEVLNILDGVNEVRKVVFLATTNYPENLGARIVNRPSRFDKRFRIGFPSDVSRRMYFEHFINGKAGELKIDIDRWVRDTDRLSVAHLKELFVAVVILGDPYEEAIQTLQSMKEQLQDKEAGTIGFGGGSVNDDFYN
jgi:hypothetical protein